MQKFQETPWQFGIRHLLGAMFVVAVLSALIAPWVRGWSAGQWLAIGTQTGVVAATFAVCIGGHALVRRRVTRRLGAQHFRMTARTWGQTTWKPAAAYAMIGFASFMLFLLAASAIVTGGKIGAPYFQGIYAGVFAALGLTQLQYPPDQLVVGQHGVAIASRFIPWERLSYSYERRGRPAPLLLKTAGWAFAVEAPAEIEQDVVKYIHQRAKVWEDPSPRKKAW